ncbi:MAG: M28 family metallopeptidase [Thermoanaerobaculia bacterium]
MNRHRAVGTLAVVALLGLAAPLAAQPDAALEAGLRAHALFLADDALRGRDTGTPEYEIAARYVASELRALGIEPAGADGGYLQPVRYRRSLLDAGSARVTLHAAGGDVDLAWKDDFLMDGDATREELEVTAPVVFVGYGVEAPELGWNDFEGLDVAGKIVLEFRGAPASFPHNERAYYSSGRTKRQLAVERGAVGILTLSGRDRLERVPWERVTRNAGRPELAWIDEDGSIADETPEIRGQASLGPSGARRLLAAAGADYEAVLDAEAAGTPEGFELPLEVTLSSRTAHEEVEASNVVGLLRGSDPQLAAEHVVYSAHLDHVGVGAPVEGDEIYNGLYDNAMGVSVMLEVARLFTGLDEAPRRSILFVAVGGEEKGLLGSDYFAHHPTVAPESLVADVNLDMPLFLFPITDVIAFGAEHSDLQGPVDAAARAVGWTLSEDPLPEETLFIRSDQYSFVRRGVPSIFVVTGFQSSRPGVDGQAVWRDFLSTTYHTPQDQAGVAVDWPSAVRFTRLNFEIGRRVADADEAPRWNDGDFFGRRFGR